jgi:hypothetical protein
MRLLNIHERLIARPLPEIFGELAALGTAADRIWPDPKLPFRRAAGPLRVGATWERHGTIRAILDSYEPNRRIVWRADLSFLRGTHTFEVRQAERGLTLVRHIIQADITWWFAPVWRLYVSGIHDRILEGLLDRLADGAPSTESGT